MQLTSGKVKLRIVPLGGVYELVPIGEETDRTALSGEQETRSPKSRRWRFHGLFEHRNVHARP